MKRVCLLAIAVVLIVPAAAQADATVAAGQKIQPAIDAAAAGSTITVAAGSFAEDLSVPSGKDGLRLAFQPGAAVSGSLAVASADVKLAGLVLFRTAGTDPALTATGGKLSLTDATIFSTVGDAISISEADNLIQRSTVLTTAAADGADGIAFTTGGLTVDSSVVIGGAKGTAYRVTTTDGSDDATLTLNHVTTTGAGGAIALEGQGGPVPVPLQPVGDITLKANGSIIHGASTATGDAGGLLAMPPANAVAATFTSSDVTKLTTADGASSNGDGTVTDDAAIFKPGTALRLKRDAPVIDKGGGDRHGVRPRHRRRAAHERLRHRHRRRRVHQRHARARPGGHARGSQDRAGRHRHRHRDRQERRRRHQGLRRRLGRRQEGHDRVQRHPARLREVRDLHGLDDRRRPELRRLRGDHQADHRHRRRPRRSCRSPRPSRAPR